MDRLQTLESIMVDFECDPLGYAETWRKKSGEIDLSPWYLESEEAQTCRERSWRLAKSQAPQNRCEVILCSPVSNKKPIFGNAVLAHAPCGSDLFDTDRDFGQAKIKPRGRHVKQGRIAKKQALNRIGATYYKSRFAARPVLESLFTLRDREEVNTFLQENNFLSKLILEAQGEIRKRFAQSELSLELLRDAEGVDPDTLFLYISTDLSPTDARPKLKELDRDWWLAALNRAQGKLCISLEYQ